MDDAVISISGLVKTYPGFRLEIPEFKSGRGHLHVLVGPNGAGKSTLLRLLMGLSLPEKGKVELFGLSMPKDEAAIKMRTGYVAAEMGFPSHMTAGNAIDYVQRFYPGWSQEERYRLVETFEVPEKHKYVKLSTGQKIRTLLVTAFARMPELLLLDEPFASLDPIGKETLKEEIMEYLLDGSNTVLLATNELVDVEDIIDYIHIIRGGRIVASGSPDELCKTISRYSFKGNRRNMKLKKIFRGRVIFRGEMGVAVIRKDASSELALLEEAGAMGLTSEDVTLKDAMRYYFAREAADAAPVA